MKTRKEGHNEREKHDDNETKRYGRQSVEVEKKLSLRRVGNDDRENGGDYLRPDEVDHGDEGKNMKTVIHTADAMVILNNLTLSSYAMFILLHICFIPLFPFFHFVIPHVLSPSPLNSQWPPSLPFTLPTLPSRHPFHPISPSFSFSC